MSFDGLFVLGSVPSLGPTFFFNDTPPTEIYTLSLHDALPISCPLNLIRVLSGLLQCHLAGQLESLPVFQCFHQIQNSMRSEEHTSELQSQSNLVCRLLLEKKQRKSGRTIAPSKRRSRGRTSAT